MNEALTLQTESFLFEIQASPADDWPRLAFADWLEEQGDARAEFIRLQCHGEQTSETATFSRQQEVTGAYRQECLARLAPLGVREIAFNRGFIDKIYVEGDLFLRRLHILFDLAPALTSVRWRKLPKATMHAALKHFMESPSLQTVTTLDISQNGVSGRDFEAISGVPQANRLTRLLASENHLGGHAVHALAKSPYLTRLTSLDLSRNDFADSCAAHLAAGSQLLRLENLRLDNNRLGIDGLNQLASRQSGALRTVSAVHNRIAGDGLRTLATYPGKLAWTSLNLSQNPIGTSGLSLVGQSSFFSSLEHLFLAGCQIGAEGALGLARSVHLRRLKTLDLSSNEIGPAVVPLLQSQVLRLVESLDLSQCNLPDEALLILASSSLPNLKKLGLRHQPLGEMRASLTRRYQQGLIV